MKMVSLLAVLLLSLVVGVSAACAQSAGDFTHYTAAHQPDPGTTTALPGGGTQTTFGDGWTQTNVPDGSYGAGGDKVTEKDEMGRIRSIIKYDRKGKRRHNTRVDFNPNGTMTLTYYDYSATGSLIGSKTETTQPSPPPAPSGPQTTGGPPPGAGGAPPGTGGAPPSGGAPGYGGTDTSGGGPPYGGEGSGPAPGVGAPLFGGFGFGFGVGGEDRRRR